MRSRGSGPFIITTATPTYVHLQDPFTGQELVDQLTGLPDKISTGRLIRFEIPTEDVFGEVEADTEFGALIPGQLLLWRCHSGPMLV